MWHRSCICAGAMHSLYTQAQSRAHSRVLSARASTVPLDAQRAQARQRRSRVEAVDAGNTRRADAERSRRDAEREAYALSAEVRPSSKARIERREGSEWQRLHQSLYKREYQAFHRAETKHHCGVSTYVRTIGPRRPKAGPPRKIQMLAPQLNRKRAPPGGEVILPKQLYGHARC